MPVTLDRLIQHRVLTPVDRAVPELLSRLESSAHPDVLLAAALVSEQYSRGHTCLALADVPTMSFPVMDREGEVRRYDDWPSLEAWVRALEESPLVLTVQDVRSVDETSLARLNRPLVFDRQSRRVYTARCWFCEQHLALRFARRLKAAPSAFPEASLMAHLRTLFPESELETSRDQCRAVERSIARSLAVITGGPGTGKTTTVARLLALRLLLEQDRSSAASGPLRILLMAPTGKAAQRLKESLSAAAQRLSVPQSVQTALQNITTGTIHRLLGWSPRPPEQGGPYRHTADHPLPADVVLVDEASMVDLELLYHLVTAVPESAQLILMGDRDQLVSVEAGGVLGDLCSVLDEPDQGGSKADASAQNQKTNPPALRSCLSLLSFSHRFARDSQLGRLAAAIRAGRADDVIELLKTGSEKEIQWLSAASSTVAMQDVVRQVSEAWQECLSMLRETPGGSRAILTALNRIRVLCAHRDGLTGEASLNQLIANQLQATGWLNPRRGYYFGQPVMVIANSYRQELFNGDVGLVVQAPGRDGLAVLFEDPASEDGCRHIPVPLMPETRTCFAMTVHKSQGSEFPRVVVMLPERDSPVLTRELLYTAVTRVRDEQAGIEGRRRPGFLWIAGSESILRSAVGRRVRRSGGLRDAVESRLVQEPGGG